MAEAEMVACNPVSEPCMEGVKGGANVQKLADLLRWDGKPTTCYWRQLYDW